MILAGIWEIALKPAYKDDLSRLFLQENKQKKKKKKKHTHTKILYFHSNMQNTMPQVAEANKNIDIDIVYNMNTLRYYFLLL